LTVAALKARLPRRYKEAGRGAFLWVASLTNAGTGVTCPCCGQAYRRFARFYGVHDQCPGCGSLMRHRALLLYLRDVLRPAAGSRVLHVAPERAVGGWLSSLPEVEYVSVDLDSPHADVQADLTSLPFADDCFDLVVCAHVLEHVADDRAAIAELFRVVRPGGCAVVQVPPSELAKTDEDPSVSSPAERKRRFRQYDHVRVCGADYPRRLEAAGWLVEVVDPVELLPAESRTAFVLRLGEPVYVCRRASD
jgi:SAM-dependent methyltransferase